MTETEQRPNVRVELNGGLGNQMFQAAAGLTLAHRIGAGLDFDISPLKRVPRTFDLTPFAIPATLYDKNSADRSPLARIFKSKHAAAPADWKGAVWTEKAFHYDPDFEKLSTSAYLIGYFQSPRYFESSADLVRKVFELQPHLSDAGKTYAQATRGEDTVAVHIRRGDYVSNPKATAIHGILDADYYDRALRIITRTVKKPRLIVVSDEPDTARQLLQGWADAEFVSGTTMFDDMYLIGACRHHVIANSSFSWWGAWLDARPDGLTIAPRAWFARPRLLTTYVNDLFPQGWFLT